MLGMLLANVLNPKVVDDEGERDWSPFVRPKSWGGLALGVPVFLESFGQEFLGDDGLMSQSTFDVNIKEDDYLAKLCPDPYLFK